MTGEKKRYHIEWCDRGMWSTVIGTQFNEYDNVLLTYRQCLKRDGFTVDTTCVVDTATQSRIFPESECEPC